MILLERTDCAIPRIETPRTAGLHLSDVIHDIATTSGIDHYKRGNGTNLRMEMGFLWEDVLSLALKDRLPNRLGEIRKDGILMSPDGLNVEEWELCEYKCTWKSSRSDPLDNWRWCTQILGYHSGLGTNVCNLKVLYINGDYRDSGPQFFQYRLYATDPEIEENWQMIINHARSRGWI